MTMTTVTLLPSAQLQVQKILGPLQQSPVKANAAPLHKSQQHIEMICLLLSTAVRNAVHLEHSGTATFVFATLRRDFCPLKRWSHSNRAAIAG